MNRRFLSRALFSCAPVVLFEADDGTKPGGAGGSNGDPVVPPVANTNPSDKTDFKALAQAVVAEVLQAQSVKGDQAKALEVLAGRNARLEHALSAKDQEIGVLKSQLPDSATAKTDADELEGWRKLAEQGLKKPEDALTLVTKVNDFEAKEAKRAKEELRDKAAKAAGYDPAKFSVLKGVDEWEYEIKVEKKDKEDVEVPYVKVKDANNVESLKPLSEMVAKEFPVGMADTIKAPATGEGGAQHVAQGSGGSSAGGSRYDQIRERNKKEAEESGKSSAPSLERVLNIGTNQPEM